MQDRYIIVGFSRPWKFKVLSWIIRFVEHSKFSHAYAMTYSESLERWIVYQASGMAVNFEGSKRFYEHNEPVVEYVFEVPDEIRDQFLRNAIDIIGTPYGIKQLIGICWIRLGKLFGSKLRNPFRDGAATYVCSELIGSTVEDILGISIKEDLDSLGPKELEEILASSNKGEKIIFR
jgi:hypothetical protein